MKRSKIILDLVQDKKPLSQTLYCLKLLLSELNDEKILAWINNEINGYKEDSEVLEYRHIHGCVSCDILHGFQYYYNVNLPISYSDPHILEIITMHCRESVSAIEAMMKKEEGQFCSVIQSPAYKYLQKYVDGYVQNAKVIYSVHDFSNIYASIKNSVLDILIKLEQRFGNLDTYDFEIDDSQKKEIVPIILNIIYQDNSISMGSGNKISGSHIITCS